ncbi:hypothetical protein BAUCODRAFT_68698 [Baudoinia panamericana UAMH 10762]|uniref:Ribosomal protein S36, mitochondrial n=1 Tax=Baudoinia panamericana (strain UAMH 10762) TaxID=717646 RepID=M2LS68_BAUPA|nr:uncharacterized protein BAUCODRAFT_68698 [Baudoinia panamericana UAMH 10762]EMC97317.1 hypothetical protein BAUCODRAFT_68698 [Baudoinia panamericana UAMH 10762]
MRLTRVLLQKRQPLIKFLGKRHTPKQVDHTPHAHPASPTHELPESFASYRTRAQQHGPLGAAQTAQPYGAIGGRPGRALGPVEPKKGEYWDRNELPKRFHRTRWTAAEMEALESGGASMFG